MTLFEFNLLENNCLKADEVWTNGVYLMSRPSPLVPDVEILLYQLPEFYVEIFYNHKANKILRLLSFCSVEYLQPYLSSISLKELSLK